ncbi:hypothetical protein QBC36DRAFT_381676 [Triangularia setosa]|uniref:Uncharacterized protein n=1 Tax=Triangularia setosa TaxID=2587417 RepID=A0AAN6VZB7_9PEZI|nr:hypothetical protein QBC36DRAFT_381676 [Podospora setosa]
MERLAPAHRPLRSGNGPPDIHGNRRLARHGFAATNRWSLTPGQLSKAEWGWTRWRWLPQPTTMTPYSAIHRLRISKPAGSGINSTFRTWRRSTNPFWKVLSTPRDVGVDATQTKQPECFNDAETYFVPGWARNLATDVNRMETTLDDVVKRLHKTTKDGAGGRPTSSLMFNKWLKSARKVPIPDAETALVPGTRLLPGGTTLGGKPSPSGRPDDPTARTMPMKVAGDQSQEREPRTPSRQTASDPSSFEEHDCTMTKVKSPTHVVLQGMREELASIKQAYQDLYDQILEGDQRAAQTAQASQAAQDNQPSVQPPLEPSRPGLTTPAATVTPNQHQPPSIQPTRYHREKIERLEAEKANFERQFRRQQRIIGRLLNQAKTQNKYKSPVPTGNQNDSSIPNTSADTSGASVLFLRQSTRQANAGVTGIANAAATIGTQPDAGQPGNTLDDKTLEKKLLELLGLSTASAPTQNPNITSADQAQDPKVATASVQAVTDTTTASTYFSTATQTTAAATDSTPVGTTAADQNTSRAVTTSTDANPSGTTAAKTTWTLSTGTDAPTAIPTAAGPKAPPPAAESVIVTTKQQIHAAFRALRIKLWQFSHSAAFQLDGPMSFASDMQKESGEQPFCRPELWDRLTHEQRANRICELIFMWLWRQILRPGVESFGAKAVYDPANPERGFRTLEVEMGLAGGMRCADKGIYAVNTPQLMPQQFATQTEISSPLQRLARAIAPLGERIFRTLSPVIQFEFCRNQQLVQQQIWSICHDAALLKMMFRQVPEKQMKVEVPGAHGDQAVSNKWGGQGYDKLTRVLSFQGWVRVVGMERFPGKRAIVCVPFGALTLVVNGKKVVLERAWIVENDDEKYTSLGIFVPEKPGDKRKSRDETEGADPRAEQGGQEGTLDESAAKRNRQEKPGEKENNGGKENTCEIETTGEGKKPGEKEKAGEKEKCGEKERPKETNQPVIIVSADHGDEDESEISSEHDDLGRDPTWRPSSKPAEASTGNSGQASTGNQTKDNPTQQPASQLTHQPDIPEGGLRGASSPAVSIDSIRDILRIVPAMGSTELAQDAATDDQRKKEKKKRRRQRKERDPNWVPRPSEDDETESSTERNPGPRSRRRSPKEDKNRTV